MKNIRTHFVFHICIGLVFNLLTSCKFTLEDLVDYPGDQIVVAGYGLANGQAELSIQKTTQYGQTYNGTALQADIQLFENGRPFARLEQHATDGVYRSPLEKKLQPGQSYHIEISAPGFPLIKSLPEKMPSPVLLDSVKRSSQSNNTGSYDVVLHFQDPQGENYYAAHLGRYLDGKKLPEWREVAYFSPFDIFNDLLFEGKNHQVPQIFYPRSGADTTAANGAKIALWALSPNTYRFQLGLGRATDAGSEIFQEPALIESNMENAYGFFGLIAADSVFIDF
jgi:hypothetical protein